MMNSGLRKDAVEFVPSTLKATAPSYSPSAKLQKKIEQPLPVGATSLNSSAPEFIPTKRTPNSKASPPTFPTTASPHSGSSASFPQVPAAAASPATPETPLAPESPQTPSSPSDSASYITRSKLVPSCTRPAPAKTPIFRNRWSLYADNHLDPTKWEPVLVSEVLDVAMFWRVFRHITPLSQCLSSVQKFTYYLFKTGVKPSWEDKRNIDGCQLITRVFAPAYVEVGFADKDALNDAFLLVAMAICGGTVGGDQINGIVFKSRKSEVNIEIWCTHCDRTRLEALCDTLRELIGRAIPKVGESKFTMMENRHRGQPSSPAGKKPVALKL